MFKIKDYIITPIDLYRGMLYLIKIAKKKDWIIFIILSSAFLFTKNYLGWESDSSLFFIFLMAIFLWDLDSRISIALALACLIIVPFLLAIDEKLIISELKDWAEQFAVWAYYFLVIGVLKQIWDFKKENASANNENMHVKTKSKEFKFQKNTRSKTARLNMKFTNAVSIDALVNKLEKKEKLLKYKKGEIIVMDIIPRKK
jgi:hypothetical protein